MISDLAGNSKRWPARIEESFDDDLACHSGVERLLISDIAVEANQQRDGGKLEKLV